MRTIVITDFSEKYIELESFYKELESYSTHSLLACLKANLNSNLFETRRNIQNCRKVAQKVLEILKAKADPELEIVTIDFYLASY